MSKVGFDNEKYLTTQSQHIRDRIAQFGGKLYLEFGGKLFDDYHASRVLPGFEPDSKIRMLEQLKDSYRAVILQSFGVGGLPGGASGPLARAMESWLEAGKTIVMMTQVPYEGSDMEVYQVGYQVKEKYQLMEAYNMTLEAAVTKLMWVLGRTRDPEQVEVLFYRPVQWDIIR